MPLNEVARRYADKLFLNSLEEILEKQRAELAKIGADHAKRNMMMSGAYFVAHAKVLLEQIRLLGEAKADSLVKAYEKAGLPFDDAALQEITSEVTQFCHSQQHNAVASIGDKIQQVFAGQPPPTGLDGGIVQQVATGVSVIMSRLARDLSIKRDEVILDEMKLRKAYAAALGKKWDVFICHASEDKEGFVRPLATALQASGLSVWYDEFTLKIGDSLRQKIDEGLANSRYGIVVLSSSFFAKNWPQHELDGLLSKEVVGTRTKVILPVWHSISFEEVHKNSPMLSGRVAAKSHEGLETVVRQLRDAMGL
jgi:hypothetical protein